ncbi:hypothetical protein L6164_034798 [Bauhinia variegata]|uniref:Uncharacterized protein n=1 Tax=Bauhinia variegata TaxID=167791 RepID=A0ACB9KWL0_BAUVA|nr:hypothetical protein L6164_034798 [Bauhinia variegata]
MGVSSEPFPLSLSLKDLIRGTEENKNSYGSLWSKVLAAQAKKQKVISKSSAAKVRRPSRVLTKRRAVRLIEGPRRRSNGIERRVRTLRRLLPNSESMELDGLFRETADYILSLQMRVRVMQIMVKVLTGSDDV